MTRSPALEEIQIAPRVITHLDINGRYWTIGRGENQMNDAHSDYENQIGSARASGVEGVLAPPAPATTDRPTQADLEGVIAGQAARDVEAAWDDPEELAIQALIHRALVKEIVRKGGDADNISSGDMKCLRIAQAAIRAVERRGAILG
jgi:hypothetical protein